MISRSGDAGDPVALADSLYDRYYEELFGYLYRLVGDRDQAAGLAQEALAQKVRDTLAPGRKAGQIRRLAERVALFRIATRLALGSDGSRLILRPGRSGERDAPGEDAPPPLVAWGRPGPLERGLAALRRTDRALVLLSGRYGFSLAEIAEVMGLAPGAVRGRLEAARNHLRREYEQAENS